VLSRRRQACQDRRCDGAGHQIAIHFGLRAAFNYAGAVGYGSGHAFDKANCAQSIDGWKAIQAKYLNK
jgi:hypothetical protein